MKNKKKIINVQSFDFDGCIFNGSAKNSLVEANQAFIEKISQQINQKGFAKVIFMVGSNRQSFKNDYWNNLIRNTGSCFPALQKIFNLFQGYVNTPCEIDKYLLADSYGNKPAGENFNNAVHFKIRNKKYEKNTFSDAFMDESKLNLLYAQIHRVAAQNPKTEIIYDFYDDKLIKWHGGPNILKLLKGFFEENSDLIPSNLCVRLHHYEGGEIETIADIQGTGQIDYNYEHNIKKMAVDAGLCNNAILKKPYKNSWGFFQTFFSHKPIVTYLTGAKLQYFKNSRRLIAPSIFHINEGSLLQCAIHDMHAYGEYLLSIDRKKGQIACQLADKLLALLATKQKFATTETLLTFKHEFLTLLDSENKTMATRRLAWGTIVKNCTIAITGIGIIPLIGKAAYSYASTGNITFFTKNKTTRQEKLETIREALSSFCPN